MLTASPDRRQHDASGASNDVGQGRVGSRRHLERGVPARPGHQIDQPTHRDQLTARGEQLQRRRVTSQPVIEGRLQSDTRLGAKPCHDSGREDLLDIAVRSVQADLGQHRCQAGDPCIQRIAILGRCRLPLLFGHGRRQPRAIVVSHVAHNPGPRGFTQIPIRLNRRHSFKLRRHRMPPHSNHDGVDVPSCETQSRRSRTRCGGLSASFADTRRVGARWG